MPRNPELEQNILKYLENLYESSKTYYLKEDYKVATAAAISKEMRKEDPNNIRERDVNLSLDMLVKDEKLYKKMFNTPDGGFYYYSLKPQPQAIP